MPVSDNKLILLLLYAWSAFLFSPFILFLLLFVLCSSVSSSAFFWARLSCLAHHGWKSSTSLPCPFSSFSSSLPLLLLVCLSSSFRLPTQFLHMSSHELDAVLSRISDENLRHTLSFGVGLHHAGLKDEVRKKEGERGKDDVTGMKRERKMMQKRTSFPSFPLLLLPLCCSLCPSRFLPFLSGPQDGGSHVPCRTDPSTRSFSIFLLSPSSPISASLSRLSPHPPSLVLLFLFLSFHFAFSGPQDGGSSVPRRKDPSPRKHSHSRVGSQPAW